MEVETPNPGRESVRVTVTADDLKDVMKPAGSDSADETPKPDQTPTDEQKPQRPEWVPEEFWDAETGVANYEAMAKALAEKQNAPADTPKDEGKQDETPKDETPKIDLASLQARADEDLQRDGKLTDETYAEYEKVGISRAQIDTYLAGIAALAERDRAQAFNEVGGEEAYKQITEWAKTALTPEEIAAYDQAVDSGDPGKMLAAVRGLAARHRLEAGVEGSALKQTTAKPGTGALFESKAELVKAMADPRYQRDAKYREEVQTKLHRSLAAGKQLGI